MKPLSPQRLAKLLNDIAEGIDCGESRETLRQALTQMQDMHASKIQNAAIREMARTAKALEGLKRKLDTPSPTSTAHS